MDKNFEKLFYEKIEEKKYRVIMSCISSMVRSVLVLLPTLLMRYVYNSLELGLDSKGIVGIILITFVIPVIVGVTFSVDIHLSKYIYVIIKEIRVQVMSNIVHSKLRSVLKQNKGELFSRIIASLEELADYYYYFINTTTWFITTSVVGIGLMLFINFRISLVLLVFSALQTSCSLLIQKRIEQVKGMENQLQARGTDYIVRIKNHNAFIKTALLADREISAAKDWEQDSWEICKAGIRNRQVVAFLSFILTLMRTLYLFYAAHYLFLDGSMLRGDFIALNSYIVWLSPVFEGLQECVEDMIKARENKRRVSGYLQEESRKECGQNMIPASAPESIEVSGLEFSYEDSKKALLENVSFQVKKNETFYITGASGSGKSTLLNIMSGLETEYGGEILYDASELRSLDDAWLHQNVIMVGQEVDILPTTLRENILYSGVAASDEEVINLLTSLKIEYLLDMPGGLDWNMKEIPRALSDGEKKRIAIVRAILSKPSVLLLDEPTAGLDNINKMAVTKFIEKSMDGILVIVTHDRVFPDGARVLYI
ncbi:MAG: ABC transporter ATP-binding protein [Lachnospiraceae bacterium]|nr:ABC transporter ATP-binding protein [Lachnospiraceae bacterium]